MTKNKIKDFYFAGTLIGIIGGISLNLLLLLLIKFGLNTRTFWQDMAELLFKPPQLFHWSAQLLGLIATLVVSGINGVAIALLIKLTGRNYIYVKSLSISSSFGFLLFIVIYPARGLDFLSHSITTNYVAFFTLIFYGLVVGFLMQKFTDFGRQREGSTRAVTKRVLKLSIMPEPARKKDDSRRMVKVVKPKKL